MGEIIQINEGGDARTFKVEKLRMPYKVMLSSGWEWRFSTWVSKNSVPVAGKIINRNGTYNAADEGLHGYNTLYVYSTTFEIIGKKNGKTYKVRKGGPFGNELIYEEIPSET